MDIVGTSLGLAGSVLHLVIFSIEFVSDVKQVYHKGATDSNVDLAIVASSIQSATRSLEAQLEESGQQQGTAETALDPDEKELRVLAARAAEIGRELAAGLSKVTAQQESKWKSLKTAARGMWDAEDLQKTEKRLRGIREELQLRYLTEIKKKVDRLGNESQHRMFDALERIASAQGESTLERKEIIELLIQIETVNSTRHDELVRLQAQLVAGINTLSQAQPSNPKHLRSALDDSSAWEKAYNAILASLWYPSISDREDSIRDAYADTLGWLYQDPNSTGKPWGSFIDFLQGDTRSYWITGKPGSGKSTLMKFLNSDPRTREYLTPWVAGRELLEGSFYFFYGGSDEQKSEHGLLLSLLHGLLGRKRDLIIIAFEERFRHHLLQGRDRLSTPTLHEARKALQRIFKTQPHIAFFLTVDGLDEFDPDVSKTGIESLLEFGRSLEEFPNVKVTFASRPLNHFQEAFANCPRLRMHDLTYEDIHIYVNERLENQKIMQSLLSRDPRNAKKLTRSIVETSSGVFLWVRLVVDSLLEGLRNYDEIQDLQRRVDELPKDLYDLYEVMLSRIPTIYRSQTTTLLKLVKETTGFPELSVLGLWFAERSTDEMVIDTKMSAITDEDLEYRYKEMERRLKSRCLDLVEIRPSDVANQKTLSDMSRVPKTDIYDIDNKFINAQVTFLHRSVSEFLDKFNWNAFSGVGNADMDPRLALLRSSILMVKTYRYDHQYNWSILLKMAHMVGMRVRKGVDELPVSTLLNTFDSTMSSHLTNLRAMPETDFEIPDQFMKDPGVDSHWAAWYDTAIGFQLKGGKMRPLYDQQSNFATFAIDHKLLKYLKDQVAVKGPGFLLKPGLSALGHAVCVTYPFEISHHCWGDIASFLIETGFKPTDMFGGESVWGWFFNAMPYHRNGFEYPVRAPLWLRMNYIHPMVQMLERGACTDKYLTLSLELQHKVSLLKGARFGLQYCEADTTYLPEERLELITTLKRLINVLQERGAIEQEWKRGVLVYSQPSQYGTDSHTEETPEQRTTGPSTPTSLDRLDSKVAPNISTETSEEICTEAVDDSSSGNGTQSMAELSPSLVANHQGQKDTEVALQVPTSFKHRRPLSMWLNRLGGRLRSARKG